MIPDLKLGSRTEETHSRGLTVNTDTSTKRTEAPGTNAHSCSKGERTFTGEKPLPQIAEETGCPSTCGRRPLDLYLSPRTKIYSKWTKGLLYEDLQLLDRWEQMQARHFRHRQRFSEKNSRAQEKDGKNCLTGLQDGLLQCGKPSAD